MGGVGAGGGKTGPRGITFRGWWGPKVRERDPTVLIEDGFGNVQQTLVSWMKKSFPDGWSAGFVGELKLSESSLEKGQEAGGIGVKQWAARASWGVCGTRIFRKKKGHRKRDATKSGAQNDASFGCFFRHGGLSKGIGCKRPPGWRSLLDRQTDSKVVRRKNLTG